jgi:hypothetical protein
MKLFQPPEINLHACLKTTLENIELQITNEFEKNNEILNANANFHKLL